MKFKFKFLPLFTLISFINVACSQKTEDRMPIAEREELEYSIPTEKLAIKLDTLFTGLQNPWGMTWLENDKMLITERKGEILIFEDDKFTGQKVQGLPAMYVNGQAGLLDIIPHPDYSQNGWIYISYAKAVPGGGATSIARFKLNGNQATEFEDLVVTVPAWNGGTHYGSRIVFDKDNFLFFYEW